MPSHFARCLVLPGFSVVLLFVLGPTALACKCDSPPTVLDACERSDAIVVARVSSIAKVEDNERPRPNGIRSVTMIVERVFKGDFKNGDEIVLPQGDGVDCSWIFDKKSDGRRFLFYLRKSEEKSVSDAPAWSASKCGRSNELTDATDDLLYLEKLPAVQGKTRISGTIGRWRQPELDVSRKTVKIVGPTRTFETITDDNGVFEIYDLPPGKYFVEPELPAGWKIEPVWLKDSPSVVKSQFDSVPLQPLKRVQILLEPKKHARVDIVFTIDNFVRGRVLDPKGNPMPLVCVYLLHAGRDSSGPSGCTNQRGRFEITNIPADDYVLATNLSKPTSREPFRTTFYPNVWERERAAVISIAPGQTIDDVDIVIPKFEETVTIKGWLRYSDGPRARLETVRFTVTSLNDKVNGNVGGLTNSRGQFTLTILKGLTGELEGEHPIFKVPDSDCPKVDELLAKSGRDMSLVRSNIIKLTTEQDLSDVELILPFPLCKRIQAPARPSFIP